MLRKTFETLSLPTTLAFAAGFVFCSFFPTQGAVAAAGDQQPMTIWDCLTAQHEVAKAAPKQDARGRGRAICNRLVSHYIFNPQQKTGSTNACNNQWDKLSRELGARGPTNEDFCKALMENKIFVPA